MTVAGVTGVVKGVQTLAGGVKVASLVTSTGKVVPVLVQGGAVVATTEAALLNLGMSAAGIANLMNAGEGSGSGKTEKPPCKKAGKSDPHGDAGRAKAKAEKQIKELQEKLKKATTRRDKVKIRNTILVRRAAERAAKGETHWNRG